MQLITSRLQIHPLVYFQSLLLEAQKWAASARQSKHWAWLAQGPQVLVLVLVLVLVACTV